jgi:hypothetical protein
MQFAGAHADEGEFLRRAFVRPVGPFERVGLAGLDKRETRAVFAHGEEPLDGRMQKLFP